MKGLLLVFTSAIALGSNAQVLCGTANEGQNLTLTAPAGQVFTSIEFASYGTPTGTCGSFATSGCHASNSLALVEAAFLGRNTATIAATNGVFGDPCNGTVKQLTIQARYSSTLPLTLVSFAVQKAGQGIVKLNWSTAQETQTSRFVIERSTDGIFFEIAGTVLASGTGANNYSFTERIADLVTTYYYRLKMIDLDGRFQFSRISAINYGTQSVKLSVFPNPAANFISIVSDQMQEGVITNSNGQSVLKVTLYNGTQTININNLAPGMYFLRTSEKVISFIRK